MTELALSVAPGHPAAVLVSPEHTRWLLLGLGLATGMEFYTFDSVNLVLESACPMEPSDFCAP
jgi:DHA2 family multidrug resistance protein